MDIFIQLPHGGPGAGFYVSQLVSHVQTTQRDFIIQGQQNCKLEDHTKPHSLDVWLRENCTDRHDTKQAVNEVIADLVGTRQFEVAWDLTCPDSGHPCKGIRLTKPSKT